PMDIAIRFVSKTVEDGVRRSIQSFWDEHSRRRHATQTLSEPKRKPRPNAESLRALEEFRRVLAHGADAYTESARLFLRELQKTTIPETLVLNALAGRANDHLFEPFEKIAKTCGQLEIPPQNLFHALCDVIRLRVEDSVADKNMLKIVRGQHSELLRRISA